MFKIKSITASTHDSSFGGYPYRVDVAVDVTDLLAFKKLKGDLGALVADVNDALCAINPNIPAYCPTVGQQRARRGIKRLTFTYYFKTHETAEALGLEILRLKNGEVWPVYGAFVTIKPLLTETA